MGKLWSAAAIHWSTAKFCCKWAWHSKMASTTNFPQLNTQSCQLLIS